MPKNKDLKRLVRTRMAKTGESYTTARSRILQKKKSRASQAAANAPRGDFAALAGMSDAAVRAKTGKTWPQWVRALDAIDAAKLAHRDIARHLGTEHGLTAWWAQTVTVGYERIRGLRDIGQRRGGTYEANKSRTIGVPLKKLYGAFSSSRARARWLPGVRWSVRGVTPEKSIRLDWSDDTTVEFRFTPKGAQKSQVTVQHRKLADKAEAEKMKAYWGGSLDALVARLEPPQR